MQTNLKSFFGIRVYIVVADYSAQGVAYAMDPTHNFDDAVQEWADQMERGNECCVMAIDLSTNNATDITNEARSRLARQIWLSGDDMPEWLEAA
jgi:hypothetical protein